uniref:Calponin-homology (CH) domain-containing protein n=1 Tax=Oreochromis aureus TaxID=47969 RepID=A0AAZ1XUD0_OREAU
MSGSHPRLHQSAAPAPNALSADKDAEMPATEKDLAEDAPWKKIQQNTFTRWCNEHLKCVNKRIGNLQTDLSDGLRLIGLLEVLSQKKMFRKYNQRPTFRQMQLENVSVALEFLDKENIKLVSIDSSCQTLFAPSAVNVVLLHVSLASLVFLHSAKVVVLHGSASVVSSHSDILLPFLHFHTVQTSL